MADCLQSALLAGLGFRHGFSLRAGGVSRPPFGSLNLGRAVGDDPAAVEENHRRLAQAIGYAPQRLYEVSQVHGAQVEVVDAQVAPAQFRRREADALVSTLPGVAVGVRTADCVAVLLVDPESGAVAAVHSGWKGTVANVVGVGVATLCAAAGARVRKLAAAVFPHIGEEAFEVGPEVAHQIARALPHAQGVVRERTPRPHVALGVAVCAQLRAAGLPSERIEVVPGCTFSDEARFFSFRRDGKVSGRHLAVVETRC